MKEEEDVLLKYQKKLMKNIVVKQIETIKWEKIVCKNRNQKCRKKKQTHTYTNTNKTVTHTQNRPLSILGIRHLWNCIFEALNKKKSVT